MEQRERGAGVDQNLRTGGAVHVGLNREHIGRRRRWELLPRLSDPYERLALGRIAAPCADQRQHAEGAHQRLGSQRRLFRSHTAPSNPA